MGKLFIVATPIGNLEDITFRAVKVLKCVDLIACEDTRHSRILLDKYGIRTPTLSYHQHSRLQKIDYLIDHLRNGKDIALITDAGTPGISDPGQALIMRTIDNKIETIAIPGPSAVISALSVSGFDLHQFLYLGFLPKKKGRKTLLESLKNEKRTIVFYESPYRIIKTLKELQKNLGDREMVIVREQTKKFEEIYRGKISEVIKNIKPKGEFVVIIKGK
jgi:16S rRNA (cytidine1402-2'-O)-methyltransferase